MKYCIYDNVTNEFLAGENPYVWISKCEATEDFFNENLYFTRNVPLEYNTITDVQIAIRKLIKLFTENDKSVDIDFQIYSIRDEKAKCVYPINLT